MEDEPVPQPIHHAVELLLARMESHPQEFEDDRRWARFYQHTKTHWNSTEKKLFSDKMREIRMEAIHTELLKELLK